MIVSLGTVLVIAGALLATDGRNHPRVLQSAKFLGLGALVFALVTFFAMVPRAERGHDFFALDHAQALPLARPNCSSAPPSTRHARPNAWLRGVAHAPADESGEELPPRAGEIPVAKELVRQPQPPAPQPVAAAPVEPPAAAPLQPAPAGPAVAAEKKPEAPAPGTTAATTSASPPVPTPDWFDASPKLVDGVYSMTVKSGVFTTVPECQRELDLEIKRTGDQYIDDYLGEGSSELVEVPLSYLKKNVRRAEFAEEVESESVGQMHQIRALLQFDDKTRTDFHRMQHNALVTGRLWYIGGGAALVLGLLTTLWGYLKLDLRTGGTQKGRLQLAATLVALVVAASMLLVRWVVPF